MSDLINSDLDEDAKNSWGTDQRVFDAIDREFNFSLDAAASDENRKCIYHLTKQVDALRWDWSKFIPNYVNKNVWINPPYGRGWIKKFMHKCIEQKELGVTSVMLVPSTLDAQWLPIHDISEIRIITGGRLTFIHPETNKPVAGNTKGSMFVIFRPSKMPCTVRLIDRDELLGVSK